MSLDKQLRPIPEAVIIIVGSSKNSAVAGHLDKHMAKTSINIPHNQYNKFKLHSLPFCNWKTNYNTIKLINYINLRIIYYIYGSVKNFGDKCLGSFSAPSIWF